MGTVFDAYCCSCEQWGPKINRAAGGVALFRATEPDGTYLPKGTDLDERQHPWAVFLIEHEWCAGVHLIREGNRPDENPFGRCCYKPPPSGPTFAERMFNRPEPPELGAELSGMIADHFPSGSDMNTTTDEETTNP